jgi:hypothetical protein
MKSERTAHHSAPACSSEQEVKCAVVLTIEQHRMGWVALYFRDGFQLQVLIAMKLLKVAPGQFVCFQACIERKVRFEGLFKYARLY